jgi:hypothetical protein
VTLLPLLVGLAACESDPPDCREAMASYYAANHRLYPGDASPWDVQLDEDEAVAYCEVLSGRATGAGCSRQLADWRTCLSGAPEVFPCGWGGNCDHGLASLQACVAGRPFEQLCSDGQDDDLDGLTDCFDPDCLDTLHCGGGGSFWYAYPEAWRARYDLLLVIDDSGSMSEEQAQLQSQLGALFARLNVDPRQAPNLHVGVTSTNLGTAPYEHTYCLPADADGGRLLGRECLAPGNPGYLIDVAPEGCAITRDPDTGECLAHDCTQAHCDAVEPGTLLAADAYSGCPRCRNHAEGIADALSCMAGLGASGCGFEQPLEAMRLALDDHPENAGFLREDSFLTVLFLTDEDDCSAADPRLFDASDLSLGPLSSFRCFEQGVTCDVNDRDTPGPRTGCVPREDPESLLHPVSRYVDFLGGLRDPLLLSVAAIAGPVNDGAASVSQDASGWPQLDPTCTAASGTATPAFRLAALARAFNTPDALAWAFTSICSATYVSALDGLGEDLRRMSATACTGYPLAGCADPAAAHGEPGDGNVCNDACLPQCEVREVEQRDTPGEATWWVPPCLEVCPDGYCAGNTDPALAHAGGFPAELDPELPVDRCWSVTLDPQCVDSRQAAIRLSRRVAPPPRSFVVFSCYTISPTESLCNDGVDNDEDCLVDLDDPDCAY